jgi:hypothetical protein
MHNEEPDRYSMYAQNIAPGTLLYIHDEQESRPTAVVTFAQDVGLG